MEAETSELWGKNGGTSLFNIRSDQDCYPRKAQE